jgi:hypothetical protein
MLLLGDNWLLAKLGYNNSSNPPFFNNIGFSTFLIAFFDELF